jgi:hypothetical protein
MYLTKLKFLYIEKKKWKRALEKEKIKKEKLCNLKN